MKTRRMTYKDYGLDNEEVEQIKTRCLGAESEDSYDSFLLWNSALMANPCIAQQLFDSLVKGISYDRLDKREYVPISKVDFYGYRRLCMNNYRDLLRLHGRW